MFFTARRCVSTVKPMNRLIPHSSLLVIDQLGVNRGRLGLNEALALFDSNLFDLHLVKDNKTAPVARIIPRPAPKPMVALGSVLKLPVDQSTKAYLTTPSKTKPPQQKELEISNQTSLHDLKTKVTKLCEFLEKGASVAVSVVSKPAKVSGIVSEKFDIRQVIEAAVKESCGVLGSSKMDRKALKMVFIPKKKK